MNTAASDLPGASSKARVAPLRFITAASLFDGHDAAINIMRRLIQAQGAEVIHLGHNRSVDDIVRAAIQEDADGIAISSYQGGHNEFFRYMIDKLKELGAGHIKVFGGGGGTITPDEIKGLMEYGVERIYHPHDGMELGLEAMIRDLVERTAAQRRASIVPGAVVSDDVTHIAATISAIEEGVFSDAQLGKLRKQWQVQAGRVPVIGITGTGGAGKSSVTDEILNRFLACFPDMRIAVLAVDPTRRRTGGALLGDRIRMNSLRSERIYMRSIATRRQHLATSEMLGDHIAYLKSLGFDLVIVETAGIGQSDSEIVDMVDFSVYVMTSEYGAASQLEKIDMIDFADLIVLNKYDKRGAEDALRDVRKQWQRNHVAFNVAADDIPVFPTIASQFNDPGISWMFKELCRLLVAKVELKAEQWLPDIDTSNKEPRSTAIIPGARIRYLAEIAEQGRDINHDVDTQSDIASRAQHIYESLKLLEDPALPGELELYKSDDLRDDDRSLQVLRQRYQEAISDLSPESIQLLREWPSRKAGVKSDQYTYTVRGRQITGNNYRESLSHQKIPKIAAPDYKDWGELLSFLSKENLPGAYPYTGGVYPYRRHGEDPTRMFAGEGTPERTNRRFHYLSQGQPTARLSTAFDSVTLYGEDPHERPDIYGKVGNSGVSIATVDDMKKLYSGFDLCDPTTSVSMTINGPAPMMLAFFMNTAVDQQIEKHLRETGAWDEAKTKIDSYFEGRMQPEYEGDLPPGNDGLGLGLLGISGDKVVAPQVYARIKNDTLAIVRGTVQADILKEDQAQNTCIFSTEFAMKMMGDMQQYFIENKIRNYYSISISGYHIAEAGANPISQLAFTLSNGFTIVEYYLARGMNIDDFAPNLSFFFSNGMDPEYPVIGRVARRIWARAMRERYGASARSQMLKYHVQTSGRSLHAQEISFNDIRTTLQALYAMFDNCNSLHTNAFDEAITTPTEQSVRRAVAIQLVISRELGLYYCENPWQGSFIIDELTDLVEEAVYQEFERISERGGVLGAMDTMYQRGKIQEESLYYESQKHDGSLPLVGVNMFLPKEGQEDEVHHLELIRSSETEKQDQISHVHAFQSAHADESSAALARLQAIARERGNVFAELMETVKTNSLGQISAALYDVGGEYRRNM
ncbi:MAG: methylmalonyl-CoA mutase family protein [Proteobacteria bacterium]|nr:methylmalonyl-CoA mutase family protein [Pseudomonadota bacterium]